MRTALLCFALAAATQQASKLHRDAFVFEGHVHVVNREFHHRENIGDRLQSGQFDLPRAREGGVDALFFTVFIDEEYYPGRFETKHALRLVDEALNQIERNRNVIELARNGTEIDRIHKTGKMAAVLDIEGGFDLDGDLGVLRNLYRLGVRSLQLPAHNWSNNFADSCCAPKKWNGLNERGRAVIREMNRLGMVVNISHASDETIEQALEISTAPLVATHHGLRSFNNIPRTMPDDLLKKLAAKGGVIGFHIGNSFHNRRFFEWRTKNAGKPFWDTQAILKNPAQLTIEEVDRKVAHKHPMMPPTGAPEEIVMTPAEWVAVVDRAIQIAGEDHVALGSDFDGGAEMPRGMRDVRDLSAITEAMLKRGYSEDRIRKFLGGNLLRVFRRITEGK